MEKSFPKAGAKGMNKEQKRKGTANMNGITFSLVPVADEISPNRKVYRAIVKRTASRR